MNLYKEIQPSDAPVNILDWMERNVVMKGSVRGEMFERTKFPWSNFAIESMFDGETKIFTFVKPVQGGGSGASEAVLCGWAKWHLGMIQLNYEKDEKAENRWDERVLPILKACRDLDWAGTDNDTVICKAKFLRSFVRVQGVFSSSHLDSDSVPRQINDEIHQWKPGHLAKARARQTAVWNPKAIDISNAGMQGDQLHESFLAGTQQHWEVKCPGCGEYHVMRTRWEDGRPDLGGLRYDTEGCRRDDGTFDYLKMRATIRFQMPCGFVVHDNINERKVLSMSGRYGAPRNAGATGEHKSATLEAVSVDYISWLTLIQEKHLAVRSLKSGDPEPFRRYLQERECIFYSTEHHPFHGEIVISQGVKKNREGLKDRAARFWMADWQQGYKHLGELEHFWLVIEDVMMNCNSQIVFEGKVHSENELIAILEEHDAIEHGCGIVDCTKNTKHLLQFCFTNNFYAIVSYKSHLKGFRHSEDGNWRFFDEGRPISNELNIPTKFPLKMTSKGQIPDEREPAVISVNVGGMIANHFFLRENKMRMEDTAKEEKRELKPDEYIERVIPGDVSEEFRNHWESWARVGREAKKKADDVSSGSERFQQVKKADHMLMCCAGIDMLKDFSGILGDRLAQLGIKK